MASASQKLIFPASVYTYATTTPTHEITIDGRAVITEGINLRAVQRIVAAERFYGSLNGRFDNVFVTEEGMESSQINDCRRYSGCFEKEF